MVKRFCQKMLRGWPPCYVTEEFEYEKKGAEEMVRRSIMDRICQELLNIRYRLDDLENMFANWTPQPIQVSESQLLSLPDHLRKTYVVVASKGECSATQASNLTGRSRAIESSYLNQLTRMGWLTKRRSSKTLNFRLISEQLLKKQLRQEISENGQRAHPRKTSQIKVAS